MLGEMQVNRKKHPRMIKRSNLKMFKRDGKCSKTSLRKVVSLLVWVMIIILIWVLFPLGKRMGQVQNSATKTLVGSVINYTNWMSIHQNIRRVNA